MSGEKVLTKEIAEQFLEDQKSVDLTEFTAIEDDAAGLLGTYPNTDGWIDLNRVSNLSLTALQGLAKYSGMLTLNASGISGDLISELTKTASAHTLMLCFINDLTPDMAEGFGSYTGDLLLTGVGAISDQAAEGLAGQEGLRYLYGVSCLSPKHCNILSGHKGYCLGFPHLVSLSANCAQYLSRFKGTLDLPAITWLSVAAAQALSTKSGDDINLGGLRLLTPEVREVFEQCEVTINAKWDELLPSFDSMQEVCEHFDYNVEDDG